MIELRSEELAQILREREEYRKLVGEILRTTSREAGRGLELTCIGNAAGADNMVHGRPSGGMLLHCAGRTLIVDPGQNCLAFLARLGIDPYAITDVLASHAHDDHVGDLAGAVSAALHLGLEAAPDGHVIVCPALVDYASAASTRHGFTVPAFAWRAHVHALSAHDVEVRRFDGARVRSERRVQVSEAIAVTAAPARHGQVETTAFVFDTPLGRLGYTADSEYFPGLAAAYRGTAALWINISTLGLDAIDDTRAATAGAPVHGHLGYVGVCQLIEDVRPRVAFVSHLGAQLLAHREAIERLLRKRFGAAGITVHCPRNGDRFLFEQSLTQPPRLARACA